MAKGFKHGAGGANPLNFQVVGNPRPETAKENTIWVDFDQINGWALRSSEPANPQIGMVWIGIGNASAAPFNALKKGEIYVYPASAKVYTIFNMLKIR